jgi:hypothetical protein
MVIRTFTGFVLGVILAKELSAQQPDLSSKVGTHVVITMTGELAKEYAKRTGSYTDGKFPAGLQIQTIAVIDHVTEDGKLRIEHTANVWAKEVTKNGGSDPQSTRQKDSPTQLLTLTGTIDPRRMKTEVTPVGTLISKDPISKPEPSNVESRTFTLELPDLKGLKLRTWTLVEETGE